VTGGAGHDAPHWGERPAPPPGGTEAVRIGPLELWMRCVDNEVRIAQAEYRMGPSETMQDRNLQGSEAPSRSWPYRDRR